jgi:hypothetical protein
LRLQALGLFVSPSRQAHLLGAMLRLKRVRAVDDRSAAEELRERRNQRFSASNIRESLDQVSSSTVETNSGAVGMNCDQAFFQS